MTSVTRVPRPSLAKPQRSADRLRRSVLSTDRHVAAFDLENTLIASNVVESYTWLATRRLNTPERVRYVLRTLAEAPSLSAIDKDRGDFLRFFYRRYEDAPVSQIDEDSAELLTNVTPDEELPRRNSPRARASSTRASDHSHHRRTELRRRDSAAVRRDHRRRDGCQAGRYSGHLSQVPPTGETGAEILADYCEAEGLKLEESIAYADSTSDLPMLEAVGFPVAVNPETGLAAIARRRRGWLVEDWSKTAGGPRPLLPIGPLLNERERGRKFAEQLDLRAQANEVRGGPVSGHIGTRQGRRSAR